MPRQLRLDYARAIHHVMSRGDRREDIYQDDVDRHDFEDCSAAQAPDDLLDQEPSTVTKKLRYMRGKEFMGRTRRERGAYPNGSATSEQRSPAQKGLPPGGLRRFWPGAALLLAYRPMKGMLARRASPQAKIDATHGSQFLCHSTRRFAAP